MHRAKENKRNPIQDQEVEFTDLQKPNLVVAVPRGMKRTQAVDRSYIEFLGSEGM
jgi:hypothetical protein